MKVTFKKKSIDSYLEPATITDMPILQTDMLIGRDGKIYELDKEWVCKFNGAHFRDDRTQYFGEKVTYINDYISIHLGHTSDTCYIDVPDDTEPTPAQVDTLFAYLSEIHKVNKNMCFAFDWRWTGGGGIPFRRAYGKQVGRCEKAFREELGNHLFQGFNRSPWFEIEA